MYLEGQANQRGYALAAVLVGIALLSVVMMAMLPAWRQQVRREKEAELAFRGEQYARALYLYQRKFPGAYPPNVDTLVQQRFLRKKFKDPITGEDFRPLLVGQQPQQGPGAPNPGRGGATPPGRGGATPSGQPGRGGVSGGVPGGVGGPSVMGTTGAGITAVQSTSTEASIRIYNGAGYYNQWRFLYRGRQNQPGAGAPGAPGRGGADRPGGPVGPGRGGVGPGRGGPIAVPPGGRPGGPGRGPG